MTDAVFYSCLQRGWHPDEEEKILLERRKALHNNSFVFTLAAVKKLQSLNAALCDLEAGLYEPLQGLARWQERCEKRASLRDFTAVLALWLRHQAFPTQRLRLGYFELPLGTNQLHGDNHNRLPPHAMSADTHCRLFAQLYDETVLCWSDLLCVEVVDAEVRMGASVKGVATIQFLH